MWRFCVNPVAETSHVFLYDIFKIEQQVCVSPDTEGLRIFCLEKKGGFYGYRKSVFGDGAREQAHAAVAAPIVHKSNGRCITFDGTISCINLNWLTHLDILITYATIVLAVN